MTIKTFIHQSLLAVVLIGFSCTNIVYAAGTVSGSKISTHPSWFKESFLEIAADVEEASEENKHVMLFIHLNGCPYCYKMIEENIKNSPYTDFIKKNFDVIGLNMQGDREVAIDDDNTMTEKELAQKLKVVYTPTIIFLNSENKTVARTNGYRSVKDFKLVLNYVQQKAYEKTTLTQYINQHKKSLYKFRKHPQIKSIVNLESVANKPLAVLFEDKGCFDCDALHDGYLADPEVRKVLKSFSLVRLDALSSEKIIDVNGKKTTAKAYAEKLGLSYRPSIVLFDENKEVMRIQSMLYGFHFTEVLRYVGEKHYKKYPDSFYDYLDVKTAELLKKGKNIDISK